MTKEVRIYNGENTVSSINGAGKLDSHIFSHYVQKISSEWFKDLNIRPETTWFLEKNICRTFFDINCSNIFFNLSTKAKEIKQN